jgi:hypothetical protein
MVGKTLEYTDSIANACFSCKYYNTNKCPKGDDGKYLCSVDGKSKHYGYYEKEIKEDD